MTEEFTASLRKLESAGGLYLETTEKGWFYGDQTRRFERVENVDDLQRLGLELVILYSAGSVSVQITDPGSITRMLLAKNDAIGSPIRYASDSVEALTARSGEHITLEPAKNGDKVRIRFYPLP